MTDIKRRTIRRYAYELYPHPNEGENRDLAVEVPYLYARAQGFEVWGTGYFDLAPRREDGTYDAAENRQRIDRIGQIIDAARIAFLADALLQGLTGQEAWDWADQRHWGDSVGEWVWERGTHYGVDLARIKPYPCGPEPSQHDHMASTGDVMGHGIVTRIDCPESECPTCTEPEVTE